ncbi:MAG TPA: T9SS type A sorting domain-containing protein [Flavobacteriales bacterium]|nr:T9SS type A sorting domain-containing protein [Flavobacteriales bacterium]
MNRLFVLTFALPLSFAAAAQSWCPPGATWTYEAGLFVAGFQRMTYTHDTIIAGHTAHVIDRYVAIQYPLPPPDYGFTEPYIDHTPVAAITQLEDDVVYIFSGTDRDTLYWFGALPGDHWYPAFVDDPTCQPLTVTDTSTTVVDGVPLRTLNVSGVTVMERIGCTWDMFMYCPNWIIDGPMGMRCYSDAEIEFSLVAGECELLMGVPEAERSHIALYPNPGTNQLILQLPPGTFKIQIRDALGRMICQTKAAGSPIEIDTGAWPSGLYLVHVDGQPAQRWVKE